jgi:hypothetical protein
VCLIGDTFDRGTVGFIEGENRGLIERTVTEEGLTVPKLKRRVG